MTKEVLNQTIQKSTSSIIVLRSLYNFIAIERLLGDETYIVTKMRVMSLALSSLFVLATLKENDVSGFTVAPKALRHQQHVLHSYQPAGEDVDFDFSDPSRPVVFGQRLLIPFTSASFDFGNDFQNNGPFSWLIPYSSLMGYQQGNTLVGGVSTTPSASSVSEEQRQAARQAAAESLMNISEQERATRLQYSQYMYVASALYATYSTWILDDGGIGGHFLRFIGLFPLILLARGYQLSGSGGM